MEVCLNGRYFPAGEPVLLADNRSFKYGDGVFETILMKEGRIPLATLHFARLFRGLRLLKMEVPFFEYQLVEWIIELCHRNRCMNAGRVRLHVFREGAGTGFLAEAQPLQQDYLQWSNEGISLGLYPDARKSMDALSNVKSANYLPYVMAALYAKEEGFDDCLVLNTANRLADSSKANLFIRKRGAWHTPALHQGCVDGVMRRHLIDRCKEEGSPVYQEDVSEDDLFEAEEAFLSNSLYGIRWIRQYKDKTFFNTRSRDLYDRFFSTI
jgi:branched-chain amino acid aminotransferase